MLKKSLLILAALSAALPSVPAAAQSGRYVTPPPVYLSPDLTEPWMLQLQPGSKPLYRRKLAEPTVVPAPAVLPQVRTGLPDANSYVPADDRFLPTVVTYDGPHGPGTIVIDTNQRFLYLVEGNGMARRYGVGVGRPGFEWAGRHKVTRKAEWPDWTPPPEMIQRQPYLPRFMAGGPGNPMGARALYIGGTVYRIHGTNQPWSIGQAMSSGCIRMMNHDVIDLYERVKPGTQVVVIQEEKA